ncbi:MAG: nuclear transport factor 2 family protein [Steroidobacteraceae bacterium]
MTRSNHQLVRKFFSALTSNSLSRELFTDDMTAWTTTSGRSEKEKYLAGVGILQSLFPAGLSYTIESLTAEEDRVAAEVQSRGTLVNGDLFQNVYVFMFRVRDGRIASVAEHFNPQVVRDMIMPLLQAATAKATRLRASSD